MRLTPRTALTSAAAVPPNAIQPLVELIPPAWKKLLKDEISQPYFQQLSNFVASERSTIDPKTGQPIHIYPPQNQIFAALAATPPNKVKVVLLGQDPYPTEGNAMGLSFSVNKGQPIPASLRNMFKELHKEYPETPIPNNGDLTPWAKQGVLLLNTVLTVREGAPNSHKNHGWEDFTRAIIQKLNARKEPIVFLLLGKQAQLVKSLLHSPPHFVVEAAHPSPLSTGNPKFGDTPVFSAVNDDLQKAGRGEIDWILT